MFVSTGTWVIFYITLTLPWAIVYVTLRLLNLVVETRNPSLRQASGITYIMHMGLRLIVYVMLRLLTVILRLAVQRWLSACGSQMGPVLPEHICRWLLGCCRSGCHWHS